MKIEITQQTHTVTINIDSLITKNSGFFFDDKFIYIFEKEPFIEYNIEDLKEMEYLGKIKHKIRYFLSNV